MARCDNIWRIQGAKLAVVIHIAFLSKMLDKAWQVVIKCDKMLQDVITL